MVKKYEHSPYMELQRRVYPNNPDKDDYLDAFHPEEEQLFRDLREDETQRDVVIESLKADCEVRVGRPAGL